ncbi:MAG: AGE family epimerase/isomerase [Verrucomicrobia bacterium]|nr:AGE family epimerase/isomerase [Verrucomicrobiota bacterium]
MTNLNRLNPEAVAKLRERYRAILFEDVVPWWLKHAPDREWGGYFTCLNRDGSPYAFEKYVWPTARQVWVFSHLYRKYAAQPEWLAHARHGFDFLARYALQPDGKMYFRLGRKGEPRATCLSLYTECFVAMAYAEFGSASGDAALTRRAAEMFDRILPRLGVPSDTPLLGYPILVQFHLHAHDMIRLTVARELFDKTKDSRWAREIEISIESILRRHWHPELDCFLENVALDGKPMLDLPEGRLHMPGHAIESAWMMMEVALEKDDRALLENCVAIILSSFKRGWDAPYGGLRYLSNLDGSPAHPLEADCKLMWPQCEALYATLLGWLATGDMCLKDAYAQIEEYVFSHFPDAQCGEWFGYLNRDCSPIFTAKANGWEGCFHMPRALFRCFQLLESQNE